MIENKWAIDLTKDHKTGCPGCIRKGMDNSRNNLNVYSKTESAHCFACGWTIASKEHIAKMGWDVQYEIEEEEIVTREAITKEENLELKRYTGTKSNGWRGIKNETNILAGVRYTYDDETGEPNKQFVPTTIDGELVGYKTRVFPKDFSNPVGIVGKTCDMIGQFRNKNGGRTILIVGGEVDYLSADQMLWDYKVSKNDQEYGRLAVVSPSVGETGCVKQVQAQYEFFDKFDKIIIGFDNDTAGKEATELVANVLPKGKVFIASWAMKDPNSMLMAGMEKQFISNYFGAKAYSPDGIVGSGGLYDNVMEEALVPKIPLPPFMHEVQDAMAGGPPLGVIVNLASASGTGKSTIADECTYFWVFHSPHRVGVLSMESDAGQYGTKILSRHIGVKIDLITPLEDKIKFLEQEDIRRASDELFKLPDGSDRWHLVEDRDGGIDSLKGKIMQLIIQCDCKVIIIDPIQDILEGMDVAGQGLFCTWMKGVIKSHKVTFININHIRKSGNNQKANSTGADIHEESIHGSGSLFKSAACNLLFTRNKEAEDEIEKNTTYMKMSKCRWTGNTGMVGQYYYDNATHTLHDKNDWLKSQGVVF